MTTISEYRNSRELFVNLTLRELRSRYKRSVLGWTWSLLNPLATMLIFTMVFRFILKIKASPGHGGIDVFALFLLCGLLPWNYLQNAVNASILTLIGNANLIKKTYFPRELLVAATVAAALVSHLIEMSLLLVALIAFGNVASLMYLPVTLLLIILLTVFATGISLLMSMINVFFRDVQHFISILFQVWFYMTPVVYPFALVPAHAHVFGVLLPVHRLLEINPAVEFVQGIRDTLYNVRMPSLWGLAYLVGVSLVTFALGLAVFFRYEGQLAQEL